MASGSGTQTKLLELTQETDLLHEVIITPPFLLMFTARFQLPLRNVLKSPQTNSLFFRGQMKLLSEVEL